MLAGLAAYLASIQIFSSEPLSARATKQQHMTMPLMPMRGNIMDCRRRMLAGSIEAKSVFADPKIVTEPDLVAVEVSRVLGLRREDVYRKLTEGEDRRYVWLRHGVPAERMKKVRNLEIEGLTVRDDGATFSILADGKTIRHPEEAAEALARVIGGDPQEILKDLVEAAGPRFVWLERRVSPEKVEAIRRLRLKGVALADEGVRHYPNGSLAAHVLGFVGSEDKGLEGMERLFNDRLAGRAGEAKVLVDRRRRPIWIESDEYVPAQDGQHLVLTLDATIQAFTEEALAEAQTKFKATSATGIVMDPSTGAILAMANVPSYDPARYGAFPVEARRNRAVTDTFPPGSSCKPFVATAALEAGVVRFGEVIFCENGYWAAGRLHDAGHSHGNLTFEEGVEKSSNIMFAKLGMRLGDKRLHDALVGYGFGHRTGVWLPGETTGVVFPISRWTKMLSTTRVAFGQEFSVTPLQLITGFAAIANNGKLLRPKIVRGVLDSRGQVVEDCGAPEVVGEACSPRTARQLIDRALVGVIEVGTGKAARIPGYRIFGKTGTAQLIDPSTRAVSHERYVGSFLAGAPAQNPQVVVLVAVTEPRAGGYYGGTVAAPAAKKILEQTLPYLGIPVTETITEKPGTHLVSHKAAN
jgi:cell division protein FtsI/penicillin-binding protein 2